VYNWFASAAITRLSPGAPVIFPMTRWHPADLAGRLIDLGERDPDADQWDTLIFPALAVENDPLGRVPGEALWPARYSEKALHAIRAISERYFEALFQQNPQLHDEPLFVIEDFRRGTVKAKHRFWTFDLALTENERSDYSVFGQWSYEGDILCLHRVVRMRAQWPQIKAEIKKILRAWEKDDLYFPKHLTELYAVQALRDECGDGQRIKQVSMPGDKYGRASVLSDFCKHGTVLVCLGESGDQFVLEHVGFPDTSKHDDFVDMSSVATHALGLHEEFSLAIAEYAGNESRRDAETFKELGY